MDLSDFSVSEEVLGHVRPDLVGLIRERAIAAEAVASLREMRAMVKPPLPGDPWAEVQRRVWNGLTTDILKAERRYAELSIRLSETLA